MKNSIRILLIILSGIFFCMPLYAQERTKKKVAVYMTGTNSDAAYKKVIGAKLVNAITESGEYAAVERTADFLAALSAESDYQTSGEVRDSQIARLGQKFGVRYVVVADASELFDEYFIAARLINVETGLVERAFDINGPAESMDQLVSLSKNVAGGLLGIQSSNSTWNTTATHLTLCVMDKYGVYNYISTEQWRSMSDSQKLDLTKMGIYISENGEAFLLDCREMGKGYWQSEDMPKIWQLKLIYKYKVPLNNAIKIFGGDLIINDGAYWSCEDDILKLNDDRIVVAGKAVDMTGGLDYLQDKSMRLDKRKVSALLN
ncbi:MAG: CsgG/HfaB family protein [Duncaniella sp.]|nr:CsgG/HfaB family protein [Duncaniella sp.]